MIDLQLPKPLLNPSMWPRGEALFSITHLKYGGPFRARLPKAFVVPEHFWLRLEEPSLVPIIQEAFKIGGVEILSRTALDKAEEAEWRRMGVGVFHVDSSLRSPSLLDWSREVFPDSFKEAGEMNWIRELKVYEEELGPTMFASMDHLRFWPAFLRARKLFFAETAAREWSLAQALFSPQDDSRGQGTNALLNPTLQITSGDAGMIALWRVDGQIASSEFTWQHAAVVDELRETPRLPLARLRSELDARRFVLQSPIPFETIVQDMIRSGLILLRS